MSKRKGFTHESTYNESKEWYTPRRIFDALGLEFDLDPCSPGKEIVPWIPARKHLTIVQDGLVTNWSGLAFVNPPYGADTPKWMKKLARHGNGYRLVLSLRRPCRCDTVYQGKGEIHTPPIRGKLCKAIV